jgi:putative oxidoreductase
MHALTSLVGRALLSLIFILAGYNKIGGFEGTQGYMEAAGVPGVLLPAVIALELVGGLLVLFGFFSRWVGLALAAFCVVSAALFHNNFGDQMQMNAFLKNLAMAGGFLLLFANGPGQYSINDK